MHAPILVTTTHPGLPLPPYSIGTPPTHLLALCHPHPTPPSPWATPNVDFLCTHMHVHLFWANNPPAPSIINSHPGFNHHYHPLVAPTTRIICPLCCSLGLHISNHVCNSVHCMGPHPPTSLLTMLATCSSMAGEPL